MKYFGHIVRANDLQPLLMEGCVAAVRERGERLRKWTSDVLDLSEISYADCVRLAHDRGPWRVMTATLRQGDGTDTLASLDGIPDCRGAKCRHDSLPVRRCRRSEDVHCHEAGHQDKPWISKFRKHIWQSLIRKPLKSPWILPIGQCR